MSLMIGQTTWTPALTPLIIGQTTWTPALTPLMTGPTTMDARSDAADDRMNRMQAASNLDREMIVELQAAGVVSQQHAAQMEEALRSSRTIGSAIAIIMASRQVSDDAAFAILKGASQNSNRKLRDLAEDLVRETADVGDGAGGGIGTR